MFTDLPFMASATWFPWLLDMLLKSAVLLALAGSVVLACWRASAAQRHLIWMLAVIGVLLLPVLAATLPAWPILRWPQGRSTPQQLQGPVHVSSSPLLPPVVSPEPTLPSREPQITPPTAITRADSPAMASTGEQLTPPSQPTPPASPAPSRPPVSWPVWMVLAWGMGTALVLAWTLYGYALAYRLRRRAHPAPAAWTSEMPAGVRVLMSDALAVPVVVGLLRPAILLPTQADDWPEERRRVALLHELAHLQRGDLLAHLLAQLACACYWMNPLVWVAAYRMRVERETACDDVVLDSNIRASDYAAHLLAVANVSQKGQLAPVVGIAMARSSKVGRRIKEVLDGTRNRRRMTWWSTALAMSVSVMLLMALAMAEEPAAREPGTASQTMLVTTRIPLPTTAGTIVVSPTGNHVAYIDTVNGKQVVVIDDKPGKPYEKIRAPWFERKPIIGDDRPNYFGLFFSPDGSRLAYAVVKYTGPNGEDWFAGRQVMVIDGEEGNTYNEVSIPVFSPDGRHVAYVANTGAGWVVVLDGKEFGPYDEIGGTPHFSPEVRSIVFSPMGNRLAYTVRQGKQWYVVVDNQVGPAFQDVSHLTFSPDGKRVAYVAQKDPQLSRMVVDGKEEALQFARVGPPVFSPNSQRVAYSAMKTWDWHVLVENGNERPEYGQAIKAVYSPDSRRLTVIATERGRAPFKLMVDGKQLLSADQVLRPRFSPDSRQIACITVNKECTDIRIAVDGKFLPYQAVGSSPVFSPDGTRMAYIAIINEKQVVMLDGKPLPGIEGWIYNLTFSPDGKHVVYQAHLKGEDKGAHVVVDGVVGTIYERIFSATETDLISEPSRTTIEHHEKPFFFDAPDRFHYFAVKDGAIERVEVTIPQAKGETEEFSGLKATVTVKGDAYVGMPIWASISFPKAFDLYRANLRYPFAYEPWFTWGYDFEVTRDGQPLPRRAPNTGTHGVIINGPVEGSSAPPSSPTGRLPLHLFYRFDRPGTYRLRFVLHDEHWMGGLTLVRADHTIVESKVLLVSEWQELVVKPYTAAQRQAWQKQQVANPPKDVGLLVGDYLPSLLASPDNIVLPAVQKAAAHRDPLVQGFAKKCLLYFTTTEVSRPTPGAPYHGLVVSLECAKSYRAGEPVNFKVIEKNVGEQEIRYVYLGFPNDYHLYLTAANGKPVEKTSRTLDLEDIEEHPDHREVSFSIAINLKPSEEYVRTYDLRQYFKALPPGAYTLQVRRTARSLEEGKGAVGQGALSLPCHFTIGADELEAVATPTSDAPVSFHTALLAEHGRITAYEPVLVRIEERNESSQPVYLTTTASPWTTRVLVEDARGRILAASPRSPLPLNLLISGVRLKPGESHMRMLAVSAIYPFNKPGRYTVRVQRLKLQNEIAVLAEDRVTVQVLPFDAARLKARCENLFKYTRSAPGERALSMSDLTRALLSVRHDIALPYIDWLARNWGRFEACSAMRLIGTPKALRDLNTLAQRQDKLGRTARGVLEMRMDQIIWGILGDHD